MPRLSSRALWAAHLSGKTTGPRERSSEVVPDRKPFRGVILGIDPSLRASGIGVIDFRSAEECRLLASQTVLNPQSRSMADCLGAIFEAVDAVLGAHPVEHVALEQTIYVQNVRTAQILGAARGAAMAAVARRGLAVTEYPPLRVKQAVVGFGRASKEQVIRQVQGLLKMASPLRTDEADAVAVALCHALSWKSARTRAET